jgi:hypothetical protein
VFGAPDFDGLPAVGADGLFAYDFTVPEEDDVVVAVLAYNEHGDSDLSNEKLFAAPGPDPPPPPEGSGEVIFGDFDSRLRVQYTTVPPDVTYTLTFEGGTGPYQFLVDCGGDGGWDGVIDTPAPTAEWVCTFPGDDYLTTVMGWDRATGTSWKGDVNPAVPRDRAPGAPVLVRP